MLVQQIALVVAFVVRSVVVSHDGNLLGAMVNSCAFMKWTARDIARVDSCNVRTRLSIGSAS